MLIYTGKGDYLREVPARDLNDAEVSQYGGERYLVGTGLYKRPIQKRIETIPEPPVERHYRKKSAFEEAEKEQA